MRNIEINYDAITELINNELHMIFGNLYADAGFELFVEQEREFTREVELHEKAIYIVVSFGSADTNFGQAEVPVFLECVSEENAFEVARNIITQFVVLWNMKRHEEFYQLWGSPTINTKFNEVGKGFRSLIFVSGSVSVGAGININDVARLWWKNSDSEYVEIEFLTFNDGYQGQLAPQAYPDTNGFAKSQAQYGTYTFTIVTYPLKGDFFDQINKVKYEGGHENDDFDFKIVMTDDDTGSSADNGYEIGGMRLLTANMEKNKGENATIACVFTR